MAKIKYLYNIVSEYIDKSCDDFDFICDENGTDEISPFVGKILDNLLKIDEISDGACFFGLKFKTLSFDILFVDDLKIQEVNRVYRAKDAPTDVITFSLFADDDFKMVVEDDIYLGEILISVDTAKRQAQNGLKNEILTLITHGILHLFGFDHQTDKDYNFVVEIQNRILESIKEV